MSNKLLFLIFLIIPTTIFSQSKADKEILASLQKNISEINQLSDKGYSSAGEQKFIASKFQEARLQPAINSQSYFQNIIHNSGQQFDPGTTLSINGKALAPGVDFIPLPYSAQGSVFGDPLIAVQEANLPWVMDIGNDSGAPLAGADTDMYSAMYKSAAQAAQDKATAVLFYNSHADAKDISFHPKESNPSLTIPVVYINHAAAAQYFKDQTADAKIQLTVGFYDQRDTTYNVIGSIHNGASSTIIISASQPEDKAALIALSQLLINNKRYEKENYLFVAYGKNDGAAYFLKHPVININHVNCIIQLNGIGKSNTLSPNLIVSGTNTSPQWESILRKSKDREISLQQEVTNPLHDSAPDIPSLTFSSDATGKVNAAAELKVVNYLAEIMRELNRIDKLVPSPGN